MTTYLLAAAAVTWVGDTSDPDPEADGWVPVAFKGEGTALVRPIEVTDPFTGPVGYDNAVVYARTLYWQLEADGNLSLYVNPVGPDGMAMRQVPVLDLPTALVERQCFGCKETVRGHVTDCPDCKAEHDRDGCCEYESDLSEPVFVCPCCGSEDVMEEDSEARQNALTINDDGTVTVHQDGGGGYDSDGFVCASCHSPLDLPAEYEIVYT